MRAAFSDIQEITIQDITDFYAKYGEQVNRSTVDWRIHELTQQGVLFRTSRGTYSFSKPETDEYVPEINNSLKYLAGKIRNQFPLVNTCLWTTKWLNEFMQHQPGRFYTILEVEKDAMESVFYALNDQRKEVFLNPSVDVLNNYVANAKEPIIISRLTTEAPTKEVQHVVTATLEKMLVDIFCDPDLYAAFQDSEMEYIYRTAFEKYQMNERSMLRYANRRAKQAEIIGLIENSKKRQ